MALLSITLRVFCGLFSGLCFFALVNTKDWAPAYRVSALISGIAFALVAMGFAQ